MIRSLDYNHKLYEIAKEGKSGDWVLKKLVEPRLTIVNNYDRIKGTIFRDVLLEDNPVVRLYHDFERKLFTMDDTPWHQESYKTATEAARGRVLSCGQGIGLFNVMVESKLNSGEITGLDVVELDEDVIKLTWEYTKRPGVNLVLGDAYDYIQNTNETYDFIFWDVGVGLAMVIAEAPGILELAKRLLLPGGEFMYWGQEIGEKLNGRPRGVEFAGTYDVDEPCRLCGGRRHAHLYGSLCMECAWELESFWNVNNEPRTNVELTRILQSLGYKTLKPKVSDMDIADLVIEEENKKYLIECKKDLVDSNMLKNLREKVVSYAELRDQYDGLKIAIHGNVQPGLALKLGGFIEKMGLGSWIEVLFKGDLEG